VVTQALTPRADGKGRVVISEVLTATPAIRSLIRDGKSHQIPSFMQAGGNDGMLSFDQNLAERVREELVSFDQALEICHSPEELKRLIGRV
jgi:twitching motility protein PilT